MVNVYGYIWKCKYVSNNVGKKEVNRWREMPDAGSLDVVSRLEYANFITITTKLLFVAMMEGKELNIYIQK